MLTKLTCFCNLSNQFATLSRRKKRGNGSNTESSKVNMSEETFNSYKDQVESNSILRNFRRQVFRRSQMNEEYEQMMKDIKKQDLELEKMISKKGTKEELLNNATKIGEKMINKRQPFNVSSNKSQISDYGDYTSYNKVYAQEEDRNVGNNQFLHKRNTVQKVYNFIDKLPDDYKQKRQLLQRAESSKETEQMSVAEYGKFIQAKHQSAQRLQQQDYEHYLLYKDDAQLQEGLDYHHLTDITKSYDPFTLMAGNYSTLSPQAYDNIYQLYLEGWNIRQICKRYGILPKRAKFVIWTRAYLYSELIPKLGLEFYINGRQALEKEEMWDADNYCDYGLDLENLTNENILFEIGCWNNKMLDLQRTQKQYNYALQKLEKKNKYDKHVKVEVGKIGKQNRLTKLTEWRVFRGKGSDQRFLKDKVFRQLSKNQRKFVKEYY